MTTPTEAKTPRLPLLKIVVRISRRKVMRSRFATGYGPAWKWLYDVNRPDGWAVQGAELLSIARRIAKVEAKRLGAVVECSWETRHG
jgi:hypothetical protein